MPETIAPITTIKTQTDLACLNCGRVSGVLRDKTLSALDPRHSARVWALECPHCIRGRLVQGETTTYYELRRLTTEEARASKRGPRPGPRPAKTVGSAVKTCTDCGVECDPRSTRCPRCQPLTNAKWPQLARILSDGRPHRTDELRAALGVGASSLRKYVVKLRREGHVIRVWRATYRTSVYTMEVAS